MMVRGFSQARGPIEAQANSLNVQHSYVTVCCCLDAAVHIPRQDTDAQAAAYSGGNLSQTLQQSQRICGLEQSSTHVQLTSTPGV